MKPTFVVSRHIGKGLSNDKDLPRVFDVNAV